METVMKTQMNVRLTLVSSLAVWFMLTRAAFAHFGG
jgi:hypothetical protein